MAYIHEDKVKELEEKEGHNRAAHRASRIKSVSDGRSGRWCDRWPVSWCAFALERIFADCLRSDGICGGIGSVTLGSKLSV